MKKYFILFLAILLFSFSASAANRYLCADGSDSNTCTDQDTDCCFSFIAARVSSGKISAGDTVIFENGTYHWGYEESRLGYYGDDSGTSGAPVTYKAENEHQAIIDYDQTAAYTGQLLVGKSAFLHFEDLVFIDAVKSAIRIEDEGVHITNCWMTSDAQWVPDGTSPNSQSGCALILTFYDAYNTVIEDCIIDTPPGNLSSHGIYIHSGTGIINNNIIRNSYGTGIQIQDNGTNGFDLDGEWYVINNLVYNCDTSGIYSSAYNTGFLGTHYYINNRVYNNNLSNSTVQGGFKITSSTKARNGAFIYHNSVYHNNKIGIWAQGADGGEEHLIKNNIIYDNDDDEKYEDDYTASNNVTDNPSFAESSDPTAADFLELSSGSSNCIGQGADLNVELDYEGEARDSSTPDIGADEYDAGAGDTEDPSVTITKSDPSNITADSLSVSWEASDNDSVDSCRWLIDAIPTISTGTQDDSSPAATSGYSEGANTVYVACFDPTGNRGYDSITVNLDTTAPVISNSYPSGGQQCTSDPRNVTIGFTTDEAATCRFSLDGDGGDDENTAYADLNTEFDTTGSTTHAHTISLACDASYQYWARCTDGTNANGSSEDINFTIDADVPPAADVKGFRIGDKITFLGGKRIYIGGE
jgi:hypothetical protein